MKKAFENIIVDVLVISGLSWICLILLGIVLESFDKNLDFVYTISTIFIILTLYLIQKYIWHGVIFIIVGFIMLLGVSTIEYAFIFLGMEVLFDNLISWNPLLWIMGINFVLVILFGASLVSD